MESLRDIGYSLQAAVSDVIDNSLTAGARKIELHAETHAEFPAIGILDDGTGMMEAELLEAMRPGSRSPLDSRTATDLGRFGLGLKTASFSQCRRLTVVTRRGGVTSCAVWDLDTVAKRDRWIVELPEDVATIPWFDYLAADGTLVVWQKLDRLVGPDGQGDRRDLVRQLDETVKHVEFVFHRFLSGREDREGRVAIFLNGRELTPFDPFHSHHSATQHHQEEIFALAGKEIRIRPITLPHHDKVSKDDWTRYGGPEGYVKNQGFYLYRNRRLIVHGTWFGLARQLELTKLCRVRIDMPSSLDAEWKIDVKKAWAQPPPPVRERLRRIIDRLGVPSKRAYTVRGSRLAEDSRLPVWTRSQDKNRISYGLNTEHPLLSAIPRSARCGYGRRVQEAGRANRFHAARRSTLRGPWCKRRIRRAPGAGRRRLQGNRGSDLANSQQARVVEQRHGGKDALGRSVSFSMGGGKDVASDLGGGKAGRTVTDLEKLKTMVGALLVAGDELPTQEKIRDCISDARPLCPGVTDKDAEWLAFWFETVHGVTMADGRRPSGHGIRTVAGGCACRTGSLLLGPLPAATGEQGLLQTRACHAG